MTVKASPVSLWRTAASTAAMATTGILSRLFLYGTQRVKVDGMDKFLELLKARRNERNAGLLTVSNHLSVLDDPLIWGLLPCSYMFSPRDLRYGLGSHDICFKNKALGSFFAAGQVLPTFRLHKDPRGGLFQPSISEAISLLDAPQHHWMHIFPEGRVHQNPKHEMRYFRWGVSRLLLEPAIQPSLVPMFITGFSDIMHESRGFPRFLPRVGKGVTLHVGEVVPDSRFLDLRSKWHDLKYRYCDDKEYLKTGKEAVELRIETTGRVREEVAKLRRRVGFPEEDEGAGKVETYRLQGMGMREGKLADGTWEKDT
ncbi:hypothetical protein P167DRAFT_511486 [Morchella conica CCBAS932]|uniref:Tafazzin family protein n=1 Tax=Morchella conica CCBAS932 TaxID=1392247 RepID=A0A3N4KEG8_9PEZI|nr:hypothetical protein P167DRAFT_511486 [Morchella conica CCBAS932]